MIVPKQATVTTVPDQAIFCVYNITSKKPKKTCGYYST